MKNNRKIVVTFFTVVFLLCMFNINAFAKNFSNDKYKKEVKEALKKEKSLKTTKGTLAVLYFNNQSGNTDYNSLQKGLALMLIKDFSKIKQKKIQIIERGKLQALVDELNLGISGLVKPDTAPRVGKLLGAETILYGNLLSDKKAELKVNPEMLNVMKKKSLEQKDVYGPLKEFVRIEKDILKNSLNSLKIVPTKEEKKLLDIPLSEKVSALDPLFKAVDATDRENWKEAEPLYIKSFTEDPNLLKTITELVKDIPPTVLSVTAAAMFIKKLHDMKKDKGKKKLDIPRKKLSISKDVRRAIKIENTSFKEGELKFKIRVLPGNFPDNGIYCYRVVFHPQLDSRSLPKWITDWDMDQNHINHWELNPGDFRGDTTLNLKNFLSNIWQIIYQRHRPKIAKLYFYIDKS